VNLSDVYPDAVTIPFFEALAEATALGYEHPHSLLEDLLILTRGQGLPDL
jgi:hypothetical protein